MSIRFFAAALMLGGALLPACADDGFHPDQDDHLGSAVSAASRDESFRHDVDAALSALGYRPCDARRSTCVLSSLEPIDVLEIGDPHSPEIAPSLCTISDGKIESCEDPPSRYECHFGQCWCDDGWDCIEMIFALPVDCAESFRMNPNSPGGSCYSVSAG